MMGGKWLGTKSRLLSCDLTFDHVRGSRETSKKVTNYPKNRLILMLIILFVEYYRPWALTVIIERPVAAFPVIDDVI
jgi:hypothetical protein